MNMPPTPDRQTATVVPLAAALLLGLLAWSGPAPAAQEIEPGVEYAGPVELQSSQAGLQVALPEGWTGLLPPQASAMLVGSQQHRGFLVVGAEALDANRITQLLQAPIPLDAGVTLVPSGAPQRQGNEFSADFTVQGAEPGTLARARAQLGPHGMAAYVLAVYPPDEQAVLRAELDRLASSVRWQAPASPPLAPPELASPGGPRHPQLAGQKVQRFYSGSGYSESESIHLCANGNFYRNFEAGGFTPGVASGAVQSRGDGTWSTPAGRLVLHWRDGRTSTYALDFEGTRLMLDGRRWFREPSDCQ